MRKFIFLVSIEGGKGTLRRGVPSSAGARRRALAGFSLIAIANPLSQSLIGITMTRIAAALAVVGALLLTIGGALGYLMH